jgi:putative transposase
LKGRWICDAHLIKTVDAIDKTRLDEKRELRAKDAIKRLQKKMDEQQARAGLVLDADALVTDVRGQIPEIRNTLIRGDEINLFDL